MHITIKKNRSVYFFMNKQDKVAGKNNQLDKKLEIKNNKKSQTQKMKTEIGSIEEVEDTTKYGEFVSSYFAWLTLERQKNKANEMEMIEKEKKK